MVGTRLSEVEKQMLVRAAIGEAERGMAEGEAPIGCVLAVRDQATGEVRIVARGHNRLNALQRKNAHAEIVAFENAGVGPNGEPPALPLNAKDVILASSLEPCVMCLGAAMESGVTTVLYALKAPADSGAGRVKPPDSPESSAPEIAGGILESESRRLFERWMETLGPDHPEQARFIAQLLELTSSVS